MEDEFEENSSEWLLNTLREVQLDQFYVRIRDHLQISRISHFEYVTPEDLEKVKIKPFYNRHFKLEKVFLIIIVLNVKYLEWPC